MTKFRLGNTRASKLTAAQVVMMRREWADGARQIDLVRKYGVTPTTVHNIIYGLTWQNIPAAVPDEQIMFEAEQSLNRLDAALEATEPADVGLTPEEIEKINKSLLTTDFKEPATERVDIDEMLKRRSERGGQPNEHQDQHSPTGVLCTTVESRANERPIDGRGPSAVLAGPLPEAGEEAGEDGQGAQSTGD